MRNIALFVLFAALCCAAPRYTVTPFAGSDWVGDGGPARDAILLQAEGLATDNLGNLYVSDAQTHRVRRISPTGVIDTIAGTGAPGLSGDQGPATQAQLNTPYGLATDSSGNLYIADLGNNRIARVSRNGVITTIATGLLTPRNVAVDLSGNLYVSEFTASRVTRITPSGNTTTVVGPETLDSPAGLTIDRAGALYIGDTGHHTVWRLQNGSLTKYAVAFAPTGLAFDTTNKLLIADPGAAAGTLLAHDVATTSTGIVYTTDGRYLRRSATNITTVIAGLGDTAHGDNGPALSARLNNPSGLALDAQGNLFIADRDNHRIRRVDTKGVITTYAGTGLIGNDGDNGPALSASFNLPTTLRTDPTGDLYVEDSGNHRVRRITPAGFVYSTKSLPSDNSAYSIDGALRILAKDTGSPLELSVSIALPTAVTASPSGILYVADAALDRIWQLTPQPEPVTQLRIPTRIAPGMIAFFDGYRFTQPEVFIDDARAAVLAQNGPSLALLVPTQLPADAVTLDIRDRGVTIAHATIPVTTAAPQLFAAVNEDGSVNTPTTPAERGATLVIYGTGQGTATDATARIGGYLADVLYSGPVVGYEGLWQINVRVPGGFLPPGMQPLTVAVGDASASLDVALR